MKIFILNRYANIVSSPLMGVLVLLFLFSIPSFSQPSGSINDLLKMTDNRVEFQDHRFTVFQEPELKSETKAMFYSLLATAIPVGIGVAANGDAGAMMMAFGVSIGPSVGILYSEDIDRAAMGMGVRTSGVGIAAIGGLFHVLESLSNEDGLTAGDIMIAGGLSLTAASMLYDIFVESPKAARRYNECKKRKDIDLNPWVNPLNSAAGIHLKVRF